MILPPALIIRLACVIGVISTLPAEVVNSSAAKRADAQSRIADSFIKPILYRLWLYLRPSAFICGGIMRLRASPLHAPQSARNPFYLPQYKSAAAARSSYRYPPTSPATAPAIPPSAESRTAR